MPEKARRYWETTSRYQKAEGGEEKHLARVELIRIALEDPGRAGKQARADLARDGIKVDPIVHPV